jgi:hypothetical protein
MTRTRAEELALAASAAPVRPVAPRRAGGRAEAVAAMTRDVKALLVAGAVVMVAGLGWLIFGPSRPLSTPAVLGWVDQGPPPARADALLARPSSFPGGSDGVDGGAVSAPPRRSS